MTSETTTTKDKPKPEKIIRNKKTQQQFQSFVFFVIFWKVWFYTILYFIYLLKQRVLNTEFYSCIKLNLSRWKIKIMSDMMCMYPSYICSMFYFINLWMKYTKTQQHFKVIGNIKDVIFGVISKTIMQTMTTVITLENLFIYLLFWEVITLQLTKFRGVHY